MKSTKYVFFSIYMKICLGSISSIVESLISQKFEIDEAAELNSSFTVDRIISLEFQLNFLRVKYDHSSENY